MSYISERELCLLAVVGNLMKLGLSEKSILWRSVAQIVNRLICVLQW
jgi:hypothetical protein